MLPSQEPSARPGACRVHGQKRFQVVTLIGHDAVIKGVRLGGRRQERDSLVQGEHLLLLVLVVVHLSAVGQLVVPGLEHKEGQRPR